MTGSDQWLADRLTAAAADMPHNSDRLAEVLQHNRQRHHRRTILLVAAVVVVAAVSVTGVARWQRHDVRVASSPPGISHRTDGTAAVHPSPRLGEATDRLVAQLRSRGLDAVIAGHAPQLFLHAAQSSTVHMRGAGVVSPTDLNVGEYRSAADAVADAKRFRPDGSIEDRLPDGNVRRVIPEWIAPLHMYQADRLLVLYPGTDSTLLAALTSILGQPLVGH